MMIVSASCCEIESLSDAFFNVSERRAMGTPYADQDVRGALFSVYRGILRLLVFFDRFQS